MSFHKISQAAAGLAFATALARLVGLLREMASAKVFGTTGIYDAFLLAFMIPNFFRGLLAEGALSAAFIPVYTEYLTDPEKETVRKEIISICFSLSLLVTCGLYLLVLLLVPLAQAFLPAGSGWFLTFSLLKFTFPYLIFISLSALAMGILNSHKHFLLPSLAPIVLDIFWIGALFFLCPLFGKELEKQILGLCLGVVVGGMAQFFIQWPSVKRRGFSLRFNFNFKHPAILKMASLLTPVMIGMAVGPINLLVDYCLAHFLSAGMVSALWYATRLYQLPLGIFALSVSTVVLPWLAELQVRKDMDAFNKNLISSLSLVFAVLLPSTAGLIILRREIISVFFQRGMFTSSSVEVTAFALSFYSLGLIGYGGASVLTRAFYAFHDTRTPVRVGVISIITNFILDIVLMKFLQQGGIALSTSLVGLSNFFFLSLLFHRKHLPLNFRKLAGSFYLLTVASLVAGIALYGLRLLLVSYLSLPLLLMSCITLTAIVYVAVLFLYGYLDWKKPVTGS